MMFFQSVPFSELDSRLDAEYYRPAYVMMINKIRNCGSFSYLEGIEKNGCYGVLPKSEEYGIGDLRLIRGEDLDGGPLLTVSDSAPFIPNEYLRMKQARVSPEQILLLAKGATIDDEKSVGIISNSFSVNAIANGSIYKFSVQGQNDPYYIFAFLASKYGLIQKRRAISNTGIFYNDQDSIRRFIIHTPDYTMQRAIGNKVRKAATLREIAVAARREVDSLFSRKGFNLENPIDRCQYIDNEVLDDRLDLLHYRSDLIQSYRLTKQHTCVQLGEEAYFKRPRDGDHGNPEYGDGPKYIRVVDLENNRIAIRQILTVSHTYASLISKSCWAQPGDVVFSIVGTLGLCAVLGGREAMIMSRGIARIHPLTVPPYYLKAFMRTRVFQNELIRQSVGSVQRGISLAAIEQLSVPILIEDELLKIAELEEKADDSFSASEMLINEAKSSVEQLVNGELDVELVLRESEEIAGWLDANSSSMET